MAREKAGECHIETDRKGGYIEFAQGKYIEPSVAKHIDKFNIRICEHKRSGSYALIKDYKTSDKSNAKALMASDFHKCFLLPSGR